MRDKRERGSLHWQSMACRHQDDKECLASFLVWQGAEVLSGVKPANLINILDRPLPCGRNMMSLWLRHGKDVLSESELRVAEMRRTDKRLLLLIYNSSLLASTLAMPEVEPVLKDLGYPSESAGGCIAYLQQRMALHEFPHEIGFFLGYPTKDVLGFMGLNDLPLASGGPWKVYGDHKPSRVLAASHATARHHVAERLLSERSPHILLKEKRPAAERAA